MLPCLITAGATRNPVDAIRYLSAGASGQTGVTMAQRLAAHGCTVTLLGSVEALLRAPTPQQFVCEEYGSTRDLMARMERWSRAHPMGVILHSAAVGDYEARTTATKIPSGRPELVLSLTPAPKILDAIRGWEHHGPLVSFKAASPETTDEALTQIARAQLERTRSDLVFANVIGRTSADVQLVSATDVLHFPTRSSAIDALLAWVLARP